MPTSIGTRSIARTTRRSTAAGRNPAATDIKRRLSNLRGYQGDLLRLQEKLLRRADVTTREEPTGPHPGQIPLWLVLEKTRRVTRGIEGFLRSCHKPEFRARLKEKNLQAMETSYFRWIAHLEYWDAKPS